MTTKALEMLKPSKTGFFLMVEASLIDWAGHANDIAAHYREIMEYDNMMSIVLQFAQNEPNTLIIAVAGKEWGKR